MLNERIENRLRELKIICDELPIEVENRGWTKRAVDMVRKMQRIAVTLDDEGDSDSRMLEEIISYMTSSGRFSAPTLETKNDDKPKGSVGVYVVKDGKLLSATRLTATGFNMLCGPGGTMEPGETPQEAAERETYEEFGIQPLELIPFGKGAKGANGFEPELFLCTEYSGEPRCNDIEMTAPAFVSLEDLESNSGKLYAPFADGVKRLKIAVLGECDNPVNNEPEYVVKNAEKPYNNKGFRDGGVAFGMREDKGSFEESDHPRDDDGKFSSKEGGGSSKPKESGGKDEHGNSNEPDTSGGIEITPKVRKALRTKKNQAVFFSGCAQYNDRGEQTKSSSEYANEYAQSNEGVTMEGLLLSAADDFPEWDFDDMDSVKSWEKASKVYAEQASGDVRVVVRKPLRENNIFEAVEFPTLKENPNITSVTMIDADTNEATEIFRRKS